GVSSPLYAPDSLIERVYQLFIAHLETLLRELRDECPFEILIESQGKNIVLQRIGAHRESELGRPGARIANLKAGRRMPLQVKAGIERLFLAVFHLHDLESPALRAVPRSYVERHRCFSVSIIRLAKFHHQALGRVLRRLEPTCQVTFGVDGWPVSD